MMPNSLSKDIKLAVDRAANNSARREFMFKKHKFTPDFILSKIDFNRLSNICK
jgi:hypothetical protein